MSHDALAIESSSSFDASDNATNESIIVHMTLLDYGTHANVVRNNDVGVAPRWRTALIEHAEKYACESRTDAQDYAFHVNRKEVQPIDLESASELRPGTLPADANTQSMI